VTGIGSHFSRLRIARPVKGPLRGISFGAGVSALSSLAQTLAAVFKTKLSAALRRWRFRCRPEATVSGGPGAKA
jgi:hypothetical protein